MTTPAPLPKTLPTPPYGTANPRRGVNGVDPALAFARAFPVGTTLTPGTFDAWAQEHGYLSVPESEDKQADAWKAHLQRRHELRYRIMKAGTHPRMIDQGCPTFTIEALSGGTWEVRAPAEAIAQSRLTQQVNSLVITKRKALRYLMQSADWSVLPAYEKVFAESLYRDINHFANTVAFHGHELEAKFGDLQIKLRDAVARGEIPERASGGVQALIHFQPEIDDNIC